MQHSWHDLVAGAGKCDSERGRSNGVRETERGSYVDTDHTATRAAYDQCISSRRRTHQALSSHQQTLPQQQQLQQTNQQPPNQQHV